MKLKEYQLRYHFRKCIYTYLISFAQIGLVQGSVYVLSKGVTNLAWLFQLLVALTWLLNKDNSYTKLKIGMIAYILGSVSGAQYVIKLIEYIWKSPLKSFLMEIVH